MDNNDQVPIEEGLPGVEDEGVINGGEAPVLEPPRKRARFNASSDTDNKWDIPLELAEYVKEAMTEYIPDKALKDKVLEDNPVQIM